MSNVLITGGAGFIGSNLALKLIDKGYKVTILDGLRPQIHSENPDNLYTYNTIKEKVNFIKGDVGSIEDWKKSLANVDVVIHLAAETDIGQSLKNPYTGILSIFSTRIKNGNDLNIFEDGLETRDFVYIDDIIEAVILGIEKEDANYHTFNVGSGQKTDVLTVANTFKEKYGANIKISVSGNYRLGDIRHNLVDLKLIHELLGYEPKVSFKQGISNFVDWVEQQAVEVDNYEASIEEMKKKGLYK